MRDDDKQEIIIVKRYNTGDEGHHGGAWKIAFADFMTAMMALFLVLWLVNAADEETKKSVASYFNPVKLVDLNRSEKGLEDSNDPRSSGKSSSKDSTTESMDTVKVESIESTDAALFKDPFQVLNQIAEKASDEISSTELISEQIRSNGSPTEDAFLDPFALPVPEPKEMKLEIIIAANSPEQSESNTAIIGETIEAQPEPELELQEDSISKRDQSLAELDKQVLEKEIQRKNQETEEQENRKQKLAQVTKEISDEIKESFRKTLGQDEQLSESVSVEQTKDGVLISITDQFGFSMFQLGSALPKGQLVLGMRDVSDILAKREGAVRVYGHTDARPYGGKDYDNWRLSTARAHAARLMLARGGLNTERVSQVVGFADRKLKDPSAPESEINRRIEILLEVL